MKILDYYMSLPYPMEILSDVEEGGYTAKFPDLPGCLTCAEAIEKLVSNSTDAKRTWLLAAIESGLEIPEPAKEDSLSEYSGQFKLRMLKSLHKDLAINAKREGISMNHYCIYLLSKNNAECSSMHPSM